MSGNLKMTVNVSLCGSIPRSQMNFCSTKRLRESNVNVNMNARNTTVPSNTSSSTTSTVAPEKLCIPRQVSQETISLPPSAPIIDPPTWAVAARGESRLEPVCESLNLQSPVDLTSQAVFRIGRSQGSDIQLLHCTSSRRHAILFHHPNGSCYVVDCGSAHGTFVNGVRVKTEMQTSSSKSSGIILPHRVKKGALIRFGGPGAPSFILKSFTVGLDSLVQNLEEVKKQQQQQQNMNSFKDTLRVDQLELGRCPPTTDALLTLNTRLNAVGSSANSLSPNNMSLSLSSARLHAQLQPLQQTSSSGISFLKKRSVVSFDEDNDVEQELHRCKKMKLTTDSSSTDSSNSSSSPSTEPSFGGIGSGIAIVSPTRQKSTLVFDFDKIQRPVVSPTPVEVIEEPFPKERSSNDNSLRSILANPLTLPSSRRTKRRVMFSEKEPDVY